MEPVKFEFLVTGDVEKALAKIKLALSGVGDTSYTASENVARGSNEAAQAMRSSGQQQVVALQQVVDAIHKNEAAQDALTAKMNLGALSADEYATSQAALTLQHIRLTQEAGRLSTQIENEVRQNNLVDGSIEERIATLSKLRDEYARLGQAERESITGTNLLGQIREVDTELAKIQQNMGRMRSGASGFNGLGMSIQQVARELPSLTMGANMFFLAISNNLPILADNLRMARMEYDALKKSGQTATPVWKQVLSSLISWQTALVVGITLLTVYGKDIWEWTKSLFSSKKAIDANIESLDSFQKKVGESSGSAIASFKKLAAEWKALGDNLKAQEKYILDNASAIKGLNLSINDVNDANKVFVDKEPEFIESLKARASAAAAMELASEKYREAIQKMLEAETEKGKGVSVGDHLKSFTLTSLFPQIQGSTPGKDVVAEGFRNARIKKLETEGKDYETAANKAITSALEYESNAKKILTDAGIATTDAIVDGSVAAIEASIALKKEALKKLTDPKDYAAAMVVIKAEEAKLKKITGGTDSENKKQTDAQKKLRESILDNELKLQAGRIAILEDGKAKRIALIDQEYKETIAAINKEREEYKKTVKESKGKEDPAVLATFDNRDTAAGSKQTAETFDVNKEYATEYKERIKAATDVFLSEEQRKLSAVKDRYDKERQWAADQLRTGSMSQVQHKEYTVTIDKAQSKESYNTLLAELNDYKQQEAEVNAKWDALIAGARQKNDLLLEMRMQEGKKKDLSALNAQMLQESEEWQQLFSDLDNLTASQIDNLITTIESKAKGLKLNPVDLKEVTNSLNQAKQKVIEINPFGSLAKSFKTVFAKGTEESNKSTEDIKKDWINLSKSTDECFDFVNDAIAGCSVLGDLIGDAGKSSISMLQGLASAGIALSAAIKTAETSSIILASISAALTVVTALFSAFNNKDIEEAQQKYTKEKISLQKKYNLLLLEQSMLVDDMLGEDKIQKAINAVNAYYKAIEELERIKQETTVRKGRELKFDPQKDDFMEYYKNKNKKFDVSMLQNMQVITGKERYGLFNMFKRDKKENLLDVYPDLIEQNGALNVSLAKTIIETQNLTDESKEYLQSLVDAEDAAAAALQQLRDYINDTFGGLGDSLADSIVNSFRSGKDAAQDFKKSVIGVLEEVGKQMIRNLFLEKYIKQYAKDIEKLYTDGKTGTDLTNGILDATNAFFNNAEKGMEESNKFLELYQQEAAKRGFDLYKPEDVSRSAAEKGIASMSQDSANKLEGMYAATQYIASNTDKTVTNIHTLLYAAAEKWVQIEENTRFCRKLEYIEKDMKATRIGIERMNNQGVLMRSR